MDLIIIREIYCTFWEYHLKDAMKYYWEETTVRYIKMARENVNMKTKKKILLRNLHSTFYLLFLHAGFFFIYSVFLCKVIWWKTTKRATKHISKCISSHALRLQILLQNLNEIIWFLSKHNGILWEIYKCKYN